MIQFEAVIEKFKEKGDKTGWWYIEIPADLASQLNPNNKKAFRVRGRLDQHEIEWVSLIPMGDGNFIMAINGAMRKALKKDEGAKLKVELQLDKKERPLNAELLECLNDAPDALSFFNALPKSHQRYFSNWIETAKTEETKTKRIAQSVNALEMHLGFGEMIRMNKSKNEPF